MFCPFHKTLPRTSAFINWISVRFYETDCTSFVKNNFLSNHQENLENIIYRGFHEKDTLSYLCVIGRAGEPEPGVFGSLEPEPEPLEKNEKPEPLGKKSQEPV